mmetsp:Transcript_27430/g.24309  ORF Transcript_27430/g.24309 Transcript_27430/m.24309 type:complete len:189 (+) Transcript_27430:12-578(+)
MYKHLTDSGESRSKRGASLPKNRGRVAQPRPLMLQKTASSPHRTNATRVKKAYENQMEVEYREANLRNSNKVKSNKREGLDSYSKNGKAHRSPIPNVKASPITFKEQYGDSNMKGKNSSILSAANLSKIKSANVNEYGGINSKNSGGLQSYQLEKRISTSASTKSKVCLPKNRCFYLNKTNFLKRYSH